MNLRAPYSPPLPARKPRTGNRLHISRDDHTHSKIHRNHRPARARGGVVADGNDGGADAVASRFRPVAGHLLCRGRHRMGPAGDADHQLDGAAGRLDTQFEMKEAANRDGFSYFDRTSNLSGTARYLRFALRTIHEVRQPADIDVHNPREYHMCRCNGYRLMFLVALHLPSVRHSMAHRRSPRLSARCPLFPGDDAAIGRLTVGKSDAAEQTLRHALLPDRQMFRSRQEQTLLH